MGRTYRTQEQARTYWQDVLERWQDSGLSVKRGLPSPGLKPERLRC
jgi:hypothetical protein